MFRKILLLFGIAIAASEEWYGSFIGRSRSWHRPPVNRPVPSDLFGNIIVENYRLSVFIQDRYVRSEVAVHVKNTGSGSAEYDFGVKLDENEFISGLTMRVGEKVTHGEVHEKAEAKKIYNEAKTNGENAGLTTQYLDTSFNTKVNIPAGEDAYFWLTYDHQLERSKSKYNYKTRLSTFGDVENLEIIVKIKESREITTPVVTAGNLVSGFRSFSKNDISDKEVVFEYTTTNTDFNDDVHIEYDIVRPAGNGGDILIRNGYFVHFISPDDLEPIPKNIIFVIDKSGSMSGGRIEKVREAFQYIINDLDDIDKFNIVYFDTSAGKLFDESISTTLGSQRALQYVRRLYASGGTNLNDGILTALQEPPHEESQAGIIIMLSDGDTNTGERNWDTIRENVRRDNEDRFAIFTFAIGSSAPYAELEKLSVQNNGLARQIFDDSDVKDSVEDFYKSVATPLLWNMTINYANSKKSIMTSKKMFQGEELVVVGKLEDSCTGPDPAISGEGVGANFNDVSVLNEIDCGEQIDLETNTDSSGDYDPMENPSDTPSEIDLERMFVYLQIRRWKVEMKGATQDTESNLLKEKIIQQAIKHGFVTKYTSMVVKETKSEPEPVTASPRIQLDRLNNNLNQQFASRPILQQPILSIQRSISKARPSISRRPTHGRSFSMPMRGPRPRAQSSYPRTSARRLNMHQQLAMRQHSMHSRPSARVLSSSMSVRPRMRPFSSGRIMNSMSRARASISRMPTYGRSFSMSRSPPRRGPPRRLYGRPPTMATTYPAMYTPIITTTTTSTTTMTYTTTTTTTTTSTTTTTTTDSVPTITATITATLGTTETVTAFTSTTVHNLFSEFYYAMASNNLARHNGDRFYIKCKLPASQCLGTSKFY